MMKPSKIRAIFAAVFITAVFSGCDLPVGGFNLNPENTPGTGTVRLSITGGSSAASAASARTAVPAPIANLDFFDRFVLTFISVNTHPYSPKTIEITDPNDFSAPIELIIGKYELKVTAYKDIDYSGNYNYNPPVTVIKEVAIAEGTSGMFTIEEGLPVPVSVQLELIDPLTLNSSTADFGILHYDIDIGDKNEISSASIYLYPYSYQYGNLSLSNYSSYSRSLNNENMYDFYLKPGYYEIRIEIRKLENTSKTYSYSESLHIYQGMTSVFIRDFSDL